MIKIIFCVLIVDAILCVIANIALNVIKKKKEKMIDDWVMEQKKIMEKTENKESIK